MLFFNVFDLVKLDSEILLFLSNSYSINSFCINEDEYKSLKIQNTIDSISYDNTPDGQEACWVENSGTYEIVVIHNQLHKITLSQTGLIWLDVLNIHITLDLLSNHHYNNIHLTLNMPEFFISIISKNTKNTLTFFEDLYRIPYVMNNIKEDSSYLYNFKKDSFLCYKNMKIGDILFGLDFLYNKTDLVLNLYEDSFEPLVFDNPFQNSFKIFKYSKNKTFFYIVMLEKKALFFDISGININDSDFDNKFVRYLIDENYDSYKRFFEQYNINLSYLKNDAEHMNIDVNYLINNYYRCQDDYFDYFYDFQDKLCREIINKENYYHDEKFDLIYNNYNSFLKTCKVNVFEAIDDNEYFSEILKKSKNFLNIK